MRFIDVVGVGSMRVLRHACLWLSALFAWLCAYPSVYLYVRLSFVSVFPSVCLFFCLPVSVTVCRRSIAYCIFIYCLHICFCPSVLLSWPWSMGGNLALSLGDETNFSDFLGQNFDLTPNNFWWPFWPKTSISPPEIPDDLIFSQLVLGLTSNRLNTSRNIGGTKAWAVPLLSLRPCREASMSVSICRLSQVCFCLYFSLPVYLCVFRPSAPVCVSVYL